MTRHSRFVLLAALLMILLSLSSGILIARAECSSYLVQPGDTLYRIARANGLTWQELAQANGIQKPYTIYAGQCLTLVAEQSASASSAVKGLAMADPSHPEDLTALDVSWWYTWGENCNGNQNCVNMVRGMQMPASCYDVLLVGNEPNAREPYGVSISPTDAVRFVMAIQSACPSTKLVAGNVSADDWGQGNGADWLKAFLREYKLLTHPHRNYAQALGIHCYQTQPDWCIGQLAAMRRVYAGEIWLTEYNDLTGQQASFERLTDYALANFARVSLYTNRQPDAPWALNGASVVMADGTLDARGVYYAER